MNIIELATKNKNLAIRDNALLRKLTLFLGYFMVSLFIFEFFSFLVTSIMAKGYAVFESNIQNYVTMALGIGLLVCGYSISKKNVEQKKNKLKNCLGFGLCALFSLIGTAFLFAQQYSKYLIGYDASFYKLSSIVWDLGVANTFGDYPIGLTNFAIYALIFINIFIFIYCLIGFILAIRGRDTNWLSSRVKRWTMAYLVTYTILYCLVLSGLAALMAGVFVDGVSMINALAYISVFIPFIVYACSCLISYNKNMLRKVIKKQKKLDENVENA